MRLKHIKLAGFKSFVDPTKVAFPEQMTCIVGPNGCGKSNVIDAVRWVLGESSAKNLRGDAMTDVIFNGSQARKPVSQASVELVFDNTSGRVQGEFANYNEISVKRIVTRDAQSIYMLNGSKCRRRDITDLFLGTGLGPRSYAIIEQGMISRLIESRPQELRVFIEEAAGISRYKERRKETESRMNRTRDNLERLTDVREELGTQLAKLQRQAAAAKRYQTLKTEERELKAQLQVLRWNHYQSQCDSLALQVEKEQAELEKWIAEQRGSERGQTNLREQEADLQQRVDAQQEQFFQVNTQITKLEQNIQHTRVMLQQRQRQEDELRAQLQQWQEQQQLDAEIRLEAEEQHALCSATVEELALQHEEAQQQVFAAQDALQLWQQEVQQQRELHHQQQQQLSLLAADQRAAKHLVAQLEERLQAVTRELAELPPHSEAHWAACEVAEQQSAAAVTAQKNSLTNIQERRSALQHQRQQAQQSTRLAQQEEQQLRAREGALNQLLAGSQPSYQEASHRWLAKHTAVQPLSALLQVAAPWQTGVAQLLKPWLNAPVIPAEHQDIPADLPWLRPLVNSQTTVPSASLAAQQLQKAPQLSQLPLLQRIWLAEDAAQATAFLAAEPTLLAVVVAHAGVYGHGWQLQAEDEESELLWQQQLQQVQQDLAVTEEQVQRCIEHEEALRISDQELELQQQLAQQQLAELRDDWVRQQERLAALGLQRQQLVERQGKLQQEQQQLQERLQQLAAEQEERLLQHDALADEIAANAPVMAEHEHQGEQLQANLARYQQQQQAQQQQLHQAQLQASQLQAQLQHLRQSASRADQQIQQVQTRLAELAGENIADDTDWQAEALAEQLLQREAVEEELRSAREALAEVAEQLAVLNRGQGAVLEQIARQQERVQAGKLELAAARERGNALLDGLQDMNASLKSVLASMPEDAAEPLWQQRLEETARKISQLGAINLAALEEVEVQAERKAYLDAQHEDLTASLATLSEAIKKIDKETRQRFRHTYDQVNQDLQRLFPKVFGGGQAYLDLTDDDLLETGVTIMARPPGKKNSTIHLLSGGEKALTALALVFAIFRLNPAPFCLLDEVDAPLDDVNVGRFCRLVQEMSESVQFIYISHNKIAMEMATHLAGVTMQEPGVSRLVAVDVDEALALADA